MKSYKLKYSKKHIKPPAKKHALMKLILIMGYN